MGQEVRGSEPRAACILDSSPEVRSRRARSATDRQEVRAIRPASLPATLLLLVACGCSDAGPSPVPPRSPSATVPGALSDAGQLAQRVLRESRTFASGVEGKGRWLPIEVDAFRLLLREDPAAAKAAFAELRGPGNEVMRLFGLCGAWYTDRAAFEEGCQEMAKWSDDLTVRFETGCETFEKTPVATLVRARRAGGVDIESGALPLTLGGGKAK